MKCPQCGTETPDEEWNCVSCRMNVYWASQHYSDLAEIRREQGLSADAATPQFLIQVHAEAMEERAERGGRVEHKVRQIARRVMRQGRAVAADDGPGTEPDGPGSEPGDETGWNRTGTSQPDHRGGGPSVALADQGSRRGGEVG
jgi:hypothetical protein